MFFLSKTIDHFLLPPGLFVVAFAVIAVLAFRVGSRRTAWLSVACGAVLWLLSTEVVGGPLLRSLEGRYLHEVGSGAYEQAQAIVVLGGGTVHPGGTIPPSLTSEPLARTVKAAQIHRETGLPIVFAGGRVFPGRGGEAEAALAARFLRRLGIESESILLESQSRNTWENASNVISEFAFESVVLVTSAYHMRRAADSFTRQGVDVVPVPADFRSNALPYNLQSFLPNHHELYTSTKALREYVGLLYYRLRYRGT